MRMSEVKFDLKPVEKKPSRRFRKGSKYDPILDSFLESEHALVSVEVPGKKASYVKSQLNQRIEDRDLWNNVKVSVIGEELFLERVPIVDTEALRLRDQIEIEHIKEAIRQK